MTVAESPSDNGPTPGSPPAPAQGRELAIPPAAEHVTALRRERLVVEDTGPVANLMDTGRFEHLQRISTMMANSSLLPNHLRFEKGKDSNPPLPNQVVAANCFRIVNQALRWGMDPFAIIDETYLVAGKLGYQGKLVAAVVNARAGLSSRLDYQFTGSGDSRTVTVIGTFAGENEPRKCDLRLSDARTQNQMWQKDPDQKLIYSGVVKWARRFCPEVVLGVLTEDDIDRIFAENVERNGETKPQQGTAALLDRLEQREAPVEAQSTPVTSTPSKITEEEAERILQEKSGRTQSSPAPDTTTEHQSQPVEQSESADSIEEAMSQDWESSKRVLWDAARANDVTRASFESGLAKHIRLILGKSGKEESIEKSVLKGIYIAIREKRFDFATGTISKGG